MKHVVIGILTFAASVSCVEQGQALRYDRWGTNRMIDFYNSNT